ncbi:unnamed protein product [Arctia plantaginis]|uniref:THAP-type domain-containing protein n=1 Tax=Arctia plantaginis TaxID=874455 RepID=A0A8S0ZP55_ARCPL|nr:unnamed protein product [Arctia plantaginis]
MACTVSGCSSRLGVFTENNENVSFHRFPADVDLKKSWVKNVRKGDETKPTQYTRICSLHFDKSCFREGYGRKTLHSYAVPTIFPNQPLSRRPKLPTKRKLVPKYGETSAARKDEQRLHGSLPKMDRTTQTKNIGETAIDTKLRKATRLVEHYKLIATRRGTKLKNLQRKFSRLTKKNTDLVNIIQALNEKHTEYSRL